MIFLQEFNKSSKLSLKDFLLQHTIYDILPYSYELIILDNNLKVNKALNILLNKKQKSLFFLLFQLKLKKKNKQIKK